MKVFAWPSTVATTRYIWFESDALNTIVARCNIEHQNDDDDRDIYISDSSDSDTENDSGDSDGDTAMPGFRPVSRNARVVLDNLRVPISAQLITMH